MKVQKEAKEKQKEKKKKKEEEEEELKAISDTKIEVNYTCPGQWLT